MAEAQGLSSTVLQAPDIIGEQRQGEALKQQQAMQQAKFTASQQPEPYDFDAEGKLGELPAEFRTLDNKFYESINNYVLENADALNRGDAQARAKLQNAVNLYNSIKKQATLSTKKYREDAKDLKERQVNSMGFADYLLNAEKLGENLEVGDDLSMTFRDIDGNEINPFSTEVLTEPRSFYYRPANWKQSVTEVIDKPTLSRKYSDGSSIKQADASKIRKQVSNAIDLDLQYDADAQENMVNDYFKQVAGVQASPNAIMNIISGQTTTIADENGNDKVVDLKEVTDWAKKTAYDEVISEVSGARTDAQEDDGGGGFSKAKAKVRPFTENKIPTSIVANNKDQSREYTVKRGFTPKAGVSIFIEDNGQQAKANVESVFEDIGENVYADVIYQLEGSDEVRKKQRVELKQREMDRIALELGLPSDKTIYDLMPEGKPLDIMGGDREQSTQQPMQENNQEVVEIEEDFWIPN